MATDLVLHSTFFFPQKLRLQLMLGKVSTRTRLFVIVWSSVVGVCLILPVTLYLLGAQRVGVSIYPTQWSGGSSPKVVVTFF